MSEGNILFIGKKNMKEDLSFLIQIKIGKKETMRFGIESIKRLL